MAAEWLGTVSGANHFVDLFVDDAGFVWVSVHFGSSGFGHKTIAGFIALSQGLRFTEYGREGSKDARPILLM